MYFTRDKYNGHIYYLRHITAKLMHAIQFTWNFRSISIRCIENWCILAETEIQKKIEYIYSNVRSDFQPNTFSYIFGYFIFLLLFIWCTRSMIELKCQPIVYPFRQ